MEMGAQFHYESRCAWKTKLAIPPYLSISQDILMSQSCSLFPFINSLISLLILCYDRIWIRVSSTNAIVEHDVCSARFVFITLYRKLNFRVFYWWGFKGLSSKIICCFHFSSWVCCESIDFFWIFCGNKEENQILLSAKLSESRTFESPEHIELQPLRSIFLRIPSLRHQHDAPCIMECLPNKLQEADQHR